MQPSREFLEAEARKKELALKRHLEQEQRKKREAEAATQLQLEEEARVQKMMQDIAQARQSQATAEKQPVKPFEEVLAEEQA